MERPTTTLLRIGDWCVNPTSGQISREGETARLEVRTMRLLVCLAEHAGEVVSIDDLLNHVWPEVTVTPDSVYQAVASLRRLLGDDSKQPTYIATVPRLGYRMVATVTPWTDEPAALSLAQSIDSEPPIPAHFEAPASGTLQRSARKPFIIAVACGKALSGHKAVTNQVTPAPAGTRPGPSQPDGPELRMTDIAAGIAHFAACPHKGGHRNYSRWGELNSPRAWERLGNGEQLRATAGNSPGLTAKDRCKDCVRHGPW
jgi:DNA-binding winged helix-turn-helix (wHTH) protein